MSAMETEQSRGIQLTLEDDGTLSIVLSGETYKQFQEIADKRGKSLVEVLVEALRLESLFTELQGSEDKGLLIRDGDSLKEVVAF